MGNKWTSTKIKGIRYREHPTRKHGVRKDRYFSIRYQRDGKRVEEGLGWTSEGWTLDKANLTLAKLREASVTGDGPARLGEKRKATKKKKEEEAAKDISFSCIFDQFLTAGNKTKNARVLAVQQGYGEKWLLPTVGDMPIRKITASHLEAIQKEILDAGRSRQTAAHAIDIFRAAWNGDTNGN